MRVDGRRLGHSLRTHGKALSILLKEGTRGRSCHNVARMWANGLAGGCIGRVVELLLRSASRVEDGLIEEWLRSRSGGGLRHEVVLPRLRIHQDLRK